MASLLVSPPHHQQYPHHHSGMSAASAAAAASTNTNSGIAEDELLDLFASDAFSLESSRDRDLMALSGMLQHSLPPGTSPPHASSAGGGVPLIPGSRSGHGGQWIKGHAAPSGDQTYGWRPDASTSTGSPGYFSGGAAPTPSSSFNNAAFANALSPNGGIQPGQLPPPPTPQGTPMSFYNTLPSSDTTGRRSSNAGVNANGYGPAGAGAGGWASQPGLAAAGANGGTATATALPPGCRAPAVSRERAPAGIPANEWSTRLRSASAAGGYAIRPPSYQEATVENRRAHAPQGSRSGGAATATGTPHEIDQEMMGVDDDITSSERAQGRYPYGQGWAAGS